MVYRFPPQNFRFRVLELRAYHVYLLNQAAARQVSMPITIFRTLIDLLQLTANQLNGMDAFLLQNAPRMHEIFFELELAFNSAAGQANAIIVQF